RRIYSETCDRLFIPFRTLFNPVPKSGNLFIGELLLWRHVRISIWTEHLQNLALLSFLRVQHRPIFAPFEQPLAGGQHQAALFLFFIMTAKAIGLEDHHSLRRRTSHRLGRTDGSL